MNGALTVFPTYLPPATAPAQSNCEIAGNLVLTTGLKT